MKIKLFITLLAVIFLVACGKSAPKGDDNEVKKMVISLVKEKMNEEFSDGVDASRPFNISVLKDEMVNISKKEYKDKTNKEWPPINYYFDEEYEQSRKQYQAIEKQVSDSIINSLISELKILDIRIINKNNEIRKIECEGDIYQRDNKIQTIAFTAQYTEDNKLYVTISSL